MPVFYSPGKLLLTAEYFVLEGALALAVPTKKGQSLRVDIFEKKDAVLQWNSIDHLGKTWFSTGFSLPDLDVLDEKNEQTQRLQSLLLEARKLNPNFFDRFFIFSYESSG